MAVVACSCCCVSLVGIGTRGLGGRARKSSGTLSRHSLSFIPQPGDDHPSYPAAAPHTPKGVNAPGMFRGHLIAFCPRASKGWVESGQALGEAFRADLFLRDRLEQEGTQCTMDTARSVSTFSLLRPLPRGYKAGRNCSLCSL